MKKAWIRTWRDLLLQRFELEDTSFLQKHLPKGCALDSFEGKRHLGLVSMKMTDVRHEMAPDFVWFKSCHELNVRAYIIHDNTLKILERYPLGEQHPEALFCEALDARTSELRLL